MDQVEAHQTFHDVQTLSSMLRFCVERVPQEESVDRLVNRMLNSRWKSGNLVSKVKGHRCL